MKTSLSVLTLLLTLSVPTMATEAGVDKIVSVEYVHPEKFTDIKYFNGSKMKFQQRLFKAWDKFLDKEGSKILPENYRLKIQFTDIDLAGTYFLGGIDNNRIVRDIDYPRLTFKFQLLKGSTVVKQSDVTLKDMNFLRHISHKRTYQNFYYEKKLLSNWLTKKIKPLVKS